MSSFTPSHRHLKRGSVYQKIGVAKLQATGAIFEDDLLVVYLAEDGKLWACPLDEFTDGRFEEIGPSPPDQWAPQPLPKFEPALCAGGYAIKRDPCEVCGAGSNELCRRARYFSPPVRERKRRP